MSGTRAIATLAMAAIGIAAFAQARKVVTEDLENMAISRPTDASGKLPVVFLAHNHGMTKEAWGDFPEDLASKGYVVVNIGWTNGGGWKDLTDSIGKALAKYPDSIDPKRAALIGGSHGCVKILSMTRVALPISVKALVLLSLGEITTAPSGHAPILGIYGTADHLGEYYVKTEKQVCETYIDEPKTVIALDAAPHGNELVTDASTKDRVRGEIATFLGTYLK
jgi:hypothetical protein